MNVQNGGSIAAISRFNLPEWLGMAQNYPEWPGMAAVISRHGLNCILAKFHTNFVKIKLVS